MIEHQHGRFTYRYDPHLIARAVEAIRIRLDDPDRNIRGFLDQPVNEPNSQHDQNH